jgi:hypothetical protein
MEIRQIDLLVHPDWHVLYHRTDPDSPLQQELRAKWKRRSLEVSQKPNTMLLNYSAFPIDPRTIETTSLPARIQRLCQVEGERRDYLTDLFGERYLVYGVENLPQEVAMKREFTQRGFNYHPDSTLVVAYGEYLEACVSQWRNELLEALRIGEMYALTLKDHSLSFYDVSSPLAEYNLHHLLSRLPRVI